MNRRIYFLIFLLTLLTFRASSDPSDSSRPKSWLIHLEYQLTNGQKIPVDCRTAGKSFCRIQNGNDKYQLQMMAQITQDPSGSLLAYKFKYESKESQLDAEGTILVQKDLDLILLNLPSGKLSARVREDIPEKSRLIPSR